MNDDQLPDEQQNETSERTFRGRKLFPLTFRSEALFDRLRSYKTPEDYAFLVFILTQSPETLKRMRDHEIRDAFFEWCDKEGISTVTREVGGKLVFNEATEEAKRIANEIWDGLAAKHFKTEVTGGKPPDPNVTG